MSFSQKSVAVMKTVASEDSMLSEIFVVKYVPHFLQDLRMNIS
jgi:hypothetical protein